VAPKKKLKLFFSIQQKFNFDIIITLILLTLFLFVANYF